MSHPAPLSPAWFKAVRGQLSQLEIATLAGVNQQRWSAWESGSSIPSKRSEAAIRRLATKLEARGKLR